MQMIDVMKRLAELDAGNPRVVKESQQVEECGIMPMGGMGDHHTPASINMTADSGNELTGMLRDIMQLAGLNKVEPEQLGVEPEPMSLMPEPVAAVGPAIAEPLSGADSMRSVLDKLNPEPAGDDQGDDLGPFQHDSGDDEPGDEGGDDVSMAHGDVDNDGDHDMDDHDAEDDEEETDEGQYDNSPADPNGAEPFDSNQFANQENQPGAGDDSGGEKRQSNLPSAAFESLMKEYKQFIGEGDEEKPGKEEDEDEMEEGIEDRLKDLDPKNPVNIPAYQRKAASGDSASAAKNTRESVETADILKLAGLK
jgi:hypothetical protein